jgi:hypothetical protein
VAIPLSLLTVTSGWFIEAASLRRHC